MNNSIDNVMDQVSGEISEAINGGFRTIGQAIMEYLANSGTQQAAAVEITINGGVTRLVNSDGDANWNDPIPAGAEVVLAKVNSADAGSI